MKNKFIKVVNIIALVSVAFLSLMTMPANTRASLSFHDDYFSRESNDLPLVHTVEVNTDGTTHSILYNSFTSGFFCDKGYCYYMYLLAGSDFFSVEGEYYLSFEIQSINPRVERTNIYRSTTSLAEAKAKSSDIAKIVQNLYDKKYYYPPKTYEGKPNQQDYLKRMSTLIIPGGDVPKGIQVTSSEDKDKPPTLSFNNYDCNVGLTEGKQYGKQVYEDCFFRVKDARFNIINKDGEDNLFEYSNPDDPPVIIISAKEDWKRPKLEFVLKKAVVASKAAEKEQVHFFWISNQYPNLTIKFLNCDTEGKFFVPDDVNDANSFSATQVNEDKWMLRPDMRVTIDATLQPIWWSEFVNKVYNREEKGPDQTTTYGKKANYPVGYCPKTKWLNTDANTGWMSKWGMLVGATAGICDGAWTTSISTLMARSFCGLGMGMHKKAKDFVAWANDWLTAVIGLEY